LHLATAAALKLITRASQSMPGGTAELIFADVADDGPIAPVARKLGEEAQRARIRTFRDADAALEWCEDELLASTSFVAGTKFALTALDVFKGLKPEEYRLIEQVVRPLIFDTGEGSVRQGRERDAVL